MDAVHVKDIIREKGSRVWTIAPAATAFEGLEKMADKNIGALVVTEDDDKVVVGIFSERDYARKVILRGKVSRDITVGEIMTSEVLAVSPENTCEDCIALFSKKRIRHLPVMEAGKMVGLISIGDVVMKIMSEQKTALTDLENFISGAGYGG